MFARSVADGCFCARTDRMIDRCRLLGALLSRLSRRQIEASVAPRLKPKTGRVDVMLKFDRFGKVPAVVGCASSPGAPSRDELSVALELRRQGPVGSRGRLLDRNPGRAFFFGRAHFVHRTLCDTAPQLRYRRLRREEGASELPAHQVDRYTYFRELQGMRRTVRRHRAIVTQRQRGMGRKTTGSSGVCITLREVCELIVNRAG